MKTVELFYFPMSFYSMKARMYLAEKEIEPQVHIINIRSGENTTEEYLRLNPEGKVPVIRVDGYSVPDSEAIMKYGEAKFTGPSLVPTGKEDEMWDLHDDIHGLRVDLITFGTLYRPEIADKASRPPGAFVKRARSMIDGDGGEAELRKKMETMPSDLASCLELKIAQNKARIASVRNDEEFQSELAKLGQVLDQCEARLTASGPLLFGNDFCIADIDLAVLYHRVRLLGLESQFFPSSRPGLTRFVATMRERPSFQQLEKESQIPFFIRLGLGNPLAIGAVVLVIVGIGIAIWKRS